MTTQDILDQDLADYIATLPGNQLTPVIQHRVSCIDPNPGAGANCLPVLAVGNGPGSCQRERSDHIGRSGRPGSQSSLSHWPPSRGRPSRTRGRRVSSSTRTGSIPAASSRSAARTSARDDEMRVALVGYHRPRRSRDGHDRRAGPLHALDPGTRRCARRRLRGRGGLGDGVQPDGRAVRRGGAARSRATGRRRARTKACPPSRPDRRGRPRPWPAPRRRSSRSWCPAAARARRSISSRSSRSPWPSGRSGCSSGGPAGRRPPRSDRRTCPSIGV